MKKFTVLLPLIIAVSAGPAAAATGILDGLTYRGEIGLKGQPADGKDDIIFANGTLRSTACDAYGFGPGAYTAVRTAIRSPSPPRRAASRAARSTGRGRSATAFWRERSPARSC